MSRSAPPRLAGLHRGRDVGQVLISSSVAVGTVFTTIIGLGTFGFSNNKLEPRSAADVQK